MMVNAVILGDSEENASAAPPLWSGIFDVIAKALINAATYPQKSTSDTHPPFTTRVLPDDPTSLDRQVFARYMLSWIHPIMGAAQQSFKAGKVLKGYTTYSPYIRSMVGLAAFCLGIAINVEKDHVKELTASAALENVPGMLSPVALARINDDTLFIPFAVKLFVDLLCEPIAAYLILDYGPG